MAVIDASVYITMLDTRDPEHTNCLAWFTAAATSDEAVVAPSLILSEVAATISRGHSDAELAKAVAATLAGSAVIRLVAVTPQLAKRAAIIAADQRVRGADAVYLALAQQLDDVLVTLDRQQLQRGAAVAATRRP
jgi:predicted nucleic acid-binding protein